MGVGKQELSPRQEVFSGDEDEIREVAFLPSFGAEGSALGSGDFDDAIGVLNDADREFEEFLKKEEFLRISDYLRLDTP